MNDAKDFENEVALRDFLLDIECLDELLPWTQRVNLFDILKISRSEIRHSNVLCWLLDPHENHGIGDAFLRGIIQRLVENDSSGRYDIFQVLLQDLYSFSVYREWKNIDILLVSTDEKCVLAIENKVGAHEHSNQLNRYRNTLETDYPGYNHILVFLTPDGEEPSDVCNWDILSYIDVVDILERILSRSELPSAVKLMIDNYIDTVRRSIMNDQQLVDVCNRIYNKHKRALDLIFEHRIDGKAQLVNSIRRALRTLSSDYDILIDDSWNNGLGFHTRRMDQHLPSIDQAGSWGYGITYEYWFAIKEKEFALILELGGKDVPEDQQQIMRKIISLLRPNDKRLDGFTYKRVYRTKWYDLSKSDSIEADTEACVKSAVLDMLRCEDRICESLLDT